MSIEFAIIPITQSFIAAANTIQSKLKANVELSISTTIDTNYEKSFVSRINKWKKRDYNIVTIDSDFDVSNSIIVRFSDRGARAQSMGVEEFIDFVSSFEYENEEKSKIDNDNDNRNCCLS